MSVSKRADTGRWRARYRGPDGRQRSRDFDTKAEGQRWASEQQRRVRRNEWTDPDAGRATVSDMYPVWMATLTLKPKTRETYEHLWLRIVEPRWGNVRLTAITPTDARAWVASMTGARGNPAGASTKRQAFHVLSGILDAAVLERRLLTNPAREGVVGRANFLPRAVRSERKRFLTPSEVERLAEETGPHRVLILVMAYTGMRWGEVTALRVRDVDLLRMRAHVERNASWLATGLQYVAPKTHQSRAVPLPPFLREDLQELLAGKAVDDLLFTTINGRPLDPSNFRTQVLAAASRRAGLERVTAHDLRHTAASIAIQSGADVKVVQRMLGHASAAMTLDVYADLFEDRLGEVAEAMSEARARALEASVRPGATLMVGLKAVKEGDNPA